jgi:hypothetical protein
MDKNVIVIVIIFSMAFSLFSGCIDDENSNKKPTVNITYPLSGMTVSGLIMISGVASDPNGDDEIKRVEVMVNNHNWDNADGTIKWSYDWRAYEVNDGIFSIQVRSWDGIIYSDIERINVTLDNPDDVESDEHKWAIFIAAANFPDDNESKLGNGGLNYAEDMATYLIEKCSYSTSKIIILFDDGWIRKDNGYGNRVETLQERNHKYDIVYGGATINNVETSIEHVVTEANKFGDSEVFIWLFGHGHGDENDILTGGKILEGSSVFLWDDMITDNELGDLLSGLKSHKACVIVDACFSGGFADKTIYNFPTFFLLRSGIPDSGRVVMSGTCKFRLGFASTTRGPLFSLLWFEGLTTGAADGYRPGILDLGRPTRTNLFKDGKVSVEEAFYYARYILKTDEDFEDFKNMEPQINDQFPNTGFLRSMKGMILG